MVTHPKQCSFQSHKFRSEIPKRSDCGTFGGLKVFTMSRTNQPHFRVQPIVFIFKNLRKLKTAGHHKNPQTKLKEKRCFAKKNCFSLASITIMDPTSNLFFFGKWEFRECFYHPGEELEGLNLPISKTKWSDVDALATLVFNASLLSTHREPV